MEVLDSVSRSMSEMSLSSKREAAAAQGLLVGLPMLKRWTIAQKTGLELQSKVERGLRRSLTQPKSLRRWLLASAIGDGTRHTYRSTDRSRRGRHETHLPIH